MATSIGKQHAAGAYTLQRVSLRQVNLLQNGQLLLANVSRALAYRFGFADSVEFQQVFLGV